MKDHLGRKIVILSHIIRRNIDQRTEVVGLSGTQSRILNYIADCSATREVYQRDVENEFHIRRSSVTSLVQQLEKSGFIQRVSVAEDARLKKLVLTPMGVSKRNEIQTSINAFEKELDELLDADRESFKQQLELLIEKLNNA